MEYLTEEDVLAMHDDVLAQTGGGAGIRDAGALSSCVILPQDGFGDYEYYPTVAAKAAILGYTLVMNHPFVDANKRTAHAVMDHFLTINGYELLSTVDEAEAVLIAISEDNTSDASMAQEEFFTWVEQHIRPVG